MIKPRKGNRIRDGPDERRNFDEKDDCYSQSACSVSILNMDAAGGAFTSLS